MSSDERLARVESKVDSMQKELSEFKNTFHGDFVSHQKEDDHNFSEISKKMHETQLTQVEIKTSIETRLDSSNRTLKVFGSVISLISLVIAVTVIFK